MIRNIRYNMIHNIRHNMSRNISQNMSCNLSQNINCNIFQNLSRNQVYGKLTKMACMQENKKRQRECMENKQRWSMCRKINKDGD